MFTGIITHLGAVQTIDAMGGDVRLRVSMGPPFEQLVRGESIAVNGVCLTVVDFDQTSFWADVSTETLACTTLRQWVPGDLLNLERALAAGDRLGGHMVSGHVDAVARVVSISPDARAQRWQFSVPKPLLRFIASKGSIAVDGVSLTVNQVDEAGFDVALIPHTVAHTAFQNSTVGSLVNIEIDVVARYVARLQETENWV